MMIEDIVTNVVIPIIPKKSNGSKVTRGLESYVSLGNHSVVSEFAINYCTPVRAYLTAGRSLLIECT